MQSMNEELQTLNSELQAKLDELSRASNDMKNLLDSTDVAILFLDNDLQVRRFTPLTSSIIKLIPGDVGRPVTDLVSNLDYPALAEDVHKVLETLASIQTPVAAHDGRWFNVRIMPYRTLDNRIDGVVITFADITVSKELEARLRGKHASLKRHLALRSPDPAAESRRALTPSVRHRKTEDGT
jgi:two-component system CheB/CheR fusion protein